jgi:carbon monoxide dehydrogenase subunit G
MKLKNEFSVPASVDTVWQALLDPERVAPCFPGATPSRRLMAMSSPGW